MITYSERVWGTLTCVLSVLTVRFQEDVLSKGQVIKTFWLQRKHLQNHWGLLANCCSRMSHLSLRLHLDDNSLLGCLLSQGATWKNKGQKKFTSQWTFPRQTARAWTHSAKALLLVLLFGAVGVEKSECGGASGWLSENLSGRWLVTCWGCSLAGSEENASPRLPNRLWDRYKYRSKRWGDRS